MEEMSYMKFSTRLAADLCQMHNLGADKQAELAYVIELLTITILDAVLVLTFGWVLGVFWGTLTCLLTIAAFRHNAGGGHSESPYRCALVTMVVFPLLALAARYVSSWDYFLTDALSFVSVVVGFALIAIYAPVDNAKAPIVSPVRRQRLKKISLIIMMIVTLVIAGLRFSAWERANEIRMCLVMGLLWFSFNLTPIGKRLWLWIDAIKI